MAGVTNQSETKRHITYCVTAKSHRAIYTWAYLNITPFLPHTHICLAGFIVHITHHQQDNHRTLQGIYFYACYLVGLS